MSPDLLAVLIGMGSAVVYGGADFMGGFSARRAVPIMVVICSQCVGVLTLLALSPLAGEPAPTAACLLWAAAAGISGGLGLIAFYRGLSLSMGLVAPVASVLMALVPVLAALWIEGAPSGTQIAGFALAIPATWLVTRTNTNGQAAVRPLGLAVIAGVLFGLFMVCFERASSETVFLPLAAARVVSIATLTSIALITRQAQVPPRSAWPSIALTGVLDTGGNALFALAAQTGRLDVAAVLASLAPAFTVLLAWQVLREHISPAQWLGIVGALAAIALIAL